MVITLKEFWWSDMIYDMRAMEMHCEFLEGKGEKNR